MLDLDPAIRDQAYELFLQEAQDFLAILESGLLELRQGRDVPKVYSLMRAAHSIKGGAAGIGLRGIEITAHRLETVFRALYQDDIEIDLNFEELLLQSFDCLRLLVVQQTEVENCDSEAILRASEPIFKRLEACLGDSLHTSQTVIPNAAELGIDIVYEVFSGDVKQALTRLEQVLSEPTSPQAAGELRAQAEVFFGVGELVNLPGFVAIARATLDALILHPEQALGIGRAALEDFRAAQEVILAGDRTQGGEPSLMLLSFTQQEAPVAPIPEVSEQVEQIDDTAIDAAELEAIFGESANQNFNAADSFAVDDTFQDLETQLLGYTLEDSPVDLEDLDALFSDSQQSLINVDLESFIQELGEAEQPPAKEVPQEAAPKKDNLDLSSYISKPAVNDAPVRSITTANPSSQFSSTIKVDLNRIERINNLIGELVTQESSALLQTQQFQDIIFTITRRLDRFEQITKDLQDLTDQNQKANARLQAISSLRGLELNGPASTGSVEFSGFDPLQLESYNRFAMMTQDAIEEVAQMGEALRDMTLLAQQTQHIHRQKQRSLKQVRNQLLRARMFPVGDILQRFPRMIRDLSAQHHKQVTIKLSGTTTLLDKAVLEKLFDPLVHLVRNAFDHGIEMPDVREAHGKPAQATIEVRAYYRGNQTYIEVRDDGKGIDLERVRAKAIALNLVSEEVAALLPRERLYDFLFSPGFSTAAQVSELSGRGVGLDAVMAQVRALKGTLSLTSEPGKGSAFVLKFPLTLTIANLLVFSVDEHLQAIPVDSLVAIVTASSEQLQWHEGQQVYQWKDQFVPVYNRDRLSQHYPLMQMKRASRASIPLPQNGTTPLLLVAGETSLLAIPVDRILQQQELVIKPFGAIVTPPPYLYGCTILGDGALVPVIDGQALVAYQFEEIHSPFRSELTDFEKMQPQTMEHSSEPTILVVDDSLTARQALAETLKKAGYQVIQAQDGRDALSHLQQGTSIQAVFCDVEMPRMNGFEFLNYCRRELADATPPVMMLTSRSGQKHRQIAQTLGAKAYLTKPYQESMLLGVLQAVLQEAKAGKQTIAIV